MTVPPLRVDGELVIRRAVLDDAPSMSELSQEAILVSAADHYTTAQLRAWADRRTVAGHQEMVRRTTAFVAVRADTDTKTETILGFASVALTPHDPLERGEVDQLFVHPSQAGRGVAAALLAHIETAARAAGVDRLLTHASWRAVPVFERSGYRPDEVETIVVEGHELTRMRMHKRIAGDHGDCD